MVKDTECEKKELLAFIVGSIVGFFIGAVCIGSIAIFQGYKEGAVAHYNGDVKCESVLDVVVCVSDKGQL